jgi:phosphoenolpyruvate carboxylase
MADAKRDPVATAVRLLHLDLLEGRASGALARADLTALADHVGKLGLEARAIRLRAKTQAGAHAALDFAEAEIADVKQRLETPAAGIVFTAHPTFALNRAGRTEIGRLASGEKSAAPAALGASLAVALADEHQDALAAIGRAQDALAALTRDIGKALRARFGKRRSEITPAPLSLATWVGYDLDGRTDISWGETFRIRLSEKARQLRRYAALLDAAAGEKGASLRDTLGRAAALAEAQSQAFAADLDAPDNVVAAANLLTTDHPDRLISLKSAIAALTPMIEAAGTEDEKLALFALRSEMAVCGLGAARIHLRVNAAQVRSAVRADLGLDIDAEFLDRTALDAAAERARAARRLDVNFGSVFLEQMTARRQLMLCAEMIKHVDADLPIRFLIAEIEAPATVMSAVYLARLYGVDGAVDISPLFETPEALDRAGRFIDRLLDEEAYVAQIRRRGAIAVQLGFSDSGRFMGQVAADMAIERVHILLARALAARGITGVRAVVFNTHGESMGRGAHPGDFTARLDHLMTPWARARFAREGVETTAEVSFQGGDGYLHFETPVLASATVRALFDWATARPEADKTDAFYADINFSWDVFRAVKSWQEALFANPHYQRVLSVIGPNLLPVAGSRKTRRQSGTSTNDVARSMRAIPNNAILQTLAAPANVWGGLGAIAAREPERFRALVAQSSRMRGLIALADEARRLTSISVLRSYATLYSPGFWTVLASRASHGAVADRATIISERLAARALDIDFDRLANILSIDRRRLDQAGVLGAARGDEGFDPDLYILHALRMTLMVEGFRLAAAPPGFSPRHETTRESLVDLALELRFAEVADLVDEIFPETDETPPAFARLAEKASKESAPVGYPQMRKEIADPLREIDRAMKDIAVALSHAYNAYG